MRNFRYIQMWLIYSAAAFSPAFAQTYVTFSIPGSNVYVSGINDSGDVTGTVDLTHGFVRTAAGVITTFDAPGSYYTYPVSINGAGAITGDFTDSIALYRGFVRAPQGAITVFDVGAPFDTQPVGINSSGQIAGTYPNLIDSGFEREPDGTIVTFTGYNGLIANGINDAGFIVGFTGEAVGFVRDPTGAISVTKSLPGYSVYPVVINDGGVVAGYVQSFRGIAYGFVRAPGRPPQFFSANGSFGTFVTGINASGTVAGYYYEPGSKLVRGFVRNVDGTITLLDCPGFAQSSAAGINSSGVVAGTCSQTFGLDVVGFLFTP